MKTLLFAGIGFAVLFTGCSQKVEVVKPKKIFIIKEPKIIDKEIIV